MSFLRTISGIKREHKTNTHIRNLCSQEAVSSIVQKSQLRWYGHVLRMDKSRLPKQLLNFVPSDGQRKIGRPNERWIDNIKDTLCILDVDFDDAELLANDRVYWKKLVASCN